MSTQIQVASLTRETLSIYSPEVLQVIRNTYAKDATDAEFTLFAHKCAVTGLDPMLNQIFFIKYGSTARIQFAEEAYLTKAREKEGFQPPDTQIVREKDIFRAKRNIETKEMEIVEHEYPNGDRGKIVRCYSIAHRTGFRSVTVIVEMSDLDHMLSGTNKDNWNKWKADMLGKFTEQRALNKQYGLNFGDGEEDIQAAEPQPEPQRKEINPDAATVEKKPKDKPKTKAAEAAKAVEAEIIPPIDEATERKALSQSIRERSAVLGHVSDEELGAFMAAHCKKAGAKSTNAELKEFLEYVEKEIAAKEDELPA